MDAAIVKDFLFIVSYIINKHVYDCGGCGYSPYCVECYHHKCNDDNFGLSNFLTCYNYDGKYRTLVACVPEINECHYGAKDKKFYLGCGKCPEGEFWCFTCKTSKCNTHPNLNAAFKCYQSNGRLTEGYFGKARDCSANKCYLAIDHKGGEYDEIYNKYTKQGCGDCPSNTGQCHTCTSNLCNNNELLKSDKFFKCRGSDEDIYCPTSVKECHFGVKGDKLYRGCGTCPEGEFWCFTCKTTNCNTHPNLNAVFKCYQSNGKLTRDKARECDKNKCYLAIDHKDAEKKIKQGCGDCPSNIGQCKTCKSNLCNNNEIASSDKYFKCWAYGYEKICPTDAKKCHFGVTGQKSYQGCGTCPEGEFWCFTCKTSKCNTHPNLNAAFKCYQSNGRLTRGKARECDENKCYLAIGRKGIFVQNHPITLVWSQETHCESSF
uniref:Uncharacterized protein n=1 Tax=Meloidogyne hapla TaxID=6305 RepID=A0A1I8B076_MELHA